jgi:predicted permease
LRTIDSGFRPEGVVLARVDGTREATTDLASLYERLRTTVERIPGVRAASFSVIAPPSGGAGISLSATVDGNPVGSGELHVNSVGPRYFEAMGTPVLEGREFSSADGPGASRVVVVNRAFASRYMRGASAVGHRVGVAAPVASSDMSVVGVVKDAVYETMRAGAPPTIYVPFAQTEPAAVGPVTFEVAALGVPASVENAIRDELQRRLLRVPVQVSTLETQVQRTLVRERLVTMLAASFGLLGVVLAATGLYGLLAYIVVTRTKEIGIQLALGMSTSGVLRNVIGGAFRMLGSGVAVAIPIAWVGSRFISAMLFGVSPADLSTVVAAAAILALVCTLAAVVPARRASRLDPMVALRHD